MGRDPDVVVIGGPAPSDLLGEYGPKRVIEATVVVAAAIGMASAGVRPVAMPNHHSAVSPYLGRLASAAQTTAGLPLVIRVPASGSPSAMAPHPWLTVVVPSGPAAAKGLLFAAIRDPRAVLFVEPRGPVAAESVPHDDFELPLGRAATIREGDDLTIVAWGAGVAVALAAAERLAGEGVTTDVIDLRTVVPLDAEAILASVGRTGRLVVVDEAVPFTSVSSDIAALAATDGFWALDAPVGRVPLHPPDARLSDPVAPGGVLLGLEDVVGMALRVVSE